MLANPVHRPLPKAKHGHELYKAWCEEVRKAVYAVCFDNTGVPPGAAKYERPAEHWWHCWQLRVQQEGKPFLAVLHGQLRAQGVSESRLAELDLIELTMAKEIGGADYGEVPTHLPAPRGRGGKKNV